MSLFKNVTFHTTVASLNDLPADSVCEIAFAGRSNAGKSSAINTLANHSRLAFVSKMPGRTQHLNRITSYNVCYTKLLRNQRGVAASAGSSAFCSWWFFMNTVPSAASLAPAANVPASTWTVSQVEALYQMPLMDLLFRAQQVHRENFDPNA